MSGRIARVRRRTKRRASSSRSYSTLRAAACAISSSIIIIAGVTNGTRFIAHGVAELLCREPKCRAMPLVPCTPCRDIQAVLLVSPSSPALHAPFVVPCVPGPGRALRTGPYVPAQAVPCLPGQAVAVESC